MTATALLVKTSASAPRPEVSATCTSTLVRKKSFIFNQWREGGYKALLKAYPFTDNYNCPSRALRALSDNCTLFVQNCALSNM